MGDDTNERRRYDKLVRDLIPAYLIGIGKQPAYHIAEDEEFAAKLWEKLEEECGELRANPSVEELADVLEVVFALGRLLGFSEVELAAARFNKAAERGRFGERIVLEEV